jgi:hypothetical protein
MADRKKRTLIISLGALWLMDGILQLQPAMFTSTFIKTVLAPNLANQPRVVEAIIAFGIRVFSVNIFWPNLAAACIQLLIGALLILPVRDAVRRFGLSLSIAWALIVWVFGEGFGGIATGSATFFMGAPGAALLYFVLALFLLHADREPSALDKLPAAAGIIFFIGAVLNIAPMFWQPGMLSMLASMPAISGWLGTFGAQGTMLGNFLAIDVLIGLGVFLVVAPNRQVAWVTIGFLAVVWWIGQNFGGIQTFPVGLATDPNSAPVLMLFVLPTLLARRAQT